MAHYKSGLMRVPRATSSSLLVLSWCLSWVAVSMYYSVLSYPLVIDELGTGFGEGWQVVEIPRVAWLSWFAADSA